MSLATDAKVRELEGRVLKLESLVRDLSREIQTPKNDFTLIEKLKNEVQGIKMRMGKSAN